MTVIYESIITEVGEDVEAFTDENMLVIFNDTVPEELKSIAVIHEANMLKDDVESGDYFYINDVKFRILHVGDKVNETLKELGHCTIKFSSHEASDLPGTMCVEEKPIPEITKNMTIKFSKQ